MTETTRTPIAYALPIGGGWAHFCADCVANHRADAEASGTAPEILADLEPIYQFSSGSVPCCEICNRVTVEGSSFVDVGTAIQALEASTTGRERTGNEVSILGALLRIQSDLSAPTEPVTVGRGDFGR